MHTHTAATGTYTAAVVLPDDGDDFDAAAWNAPVAVALDNAGYLYQQVGTFFTGATGAGVYRLREVASAAILSTIVSANGDVCLIAGAGYVYGLYVLDTASTVPADGHTYVTAAGGGRWILSPRPFARRSVALSITGATQKIGVASANSPDLVGDSFAATSHTGVYSLKLVAPPDVLVGYTARVYYPNNGAGFAGATGSLALANIAGNVWNLAPDPANGPQIVDVEYSPTTLDWSVVSSLTL